MRKKIVAGNWKMNLGKDDAIKLVQQITNQYDELSLSETKQMILAPSFVLLDIINEAIKGYSFINIAAQNCSEHNVGAYTGEVAASMLESIGINYCIIGHSERRQYYYEDNDILIKKVQQALQYNIKPIFCCGEPIEIRTAETYFEYIEQQIKAVIFQLSDIDFKNIIIAYEPIWAIGTGRTASAAQAQEVHRFIRDLIAQQYNKETANQTTILYGGSVNAQNAADLFSCDDIDGALVGGASLKSNEFIEITKALK
ncbi:MAG: triose-phosphate isomerase [Sphingobacteriales bacterium]|jgi:triosephosphate isomerase|nr:MAG: triose-phosphate isomerase [Sphingobacteriales bacterium]